MNEQDFNYLETEGVYNGKRRYSVKDIMVLQLILFNITGERYSVNGCSACLDILKAKIKPYYDIKKQQNDAEKTTALQTRSVRKSTRKKKGSSEQDNAGNS